MLFRSDIAGNKGLLSEGQQSRAMLSAATDIQSQVGQQQMQAQMANAQHTLALSDRIDYARLSLAQMKDEANAAYKADKSAWGADVAGSVLDIAGAAVNNVINKMADKQMKLDFDALLGGKNPTEMSISELFGFSTAAMMMQYGWKPKAKSSYDDVALSLNAMTDEEKDAVLEDFKIKQWMLTNAGSTK